MDGVTPGLVIGATTGNHRRRAGIIATPGGDRHVTSTSSPRSRPARRRWPHGYTTLIGGGMGNLVRRGHETPRGPYSGMMESFAGFPINMAFISRASSSAPPLEALLEWGSSGFKIHEDLGAYPAVIDQTLRVADEHDVAGR